ncbi:odontogenic ameloblast-associated protein [Pleurodeles waltl]|uniref:odontogenic ameloblast-associated protein n=1 Tax=Pleurodeles waltl TaxID=8319 RepID=UPI0037094715
MKIVALLLCLIGTSWSSPMIPRRIFSASASNEVLLALSLNNGLLPPQLQGATLSRLLPGILQQQIPGLGQVRYGAGGPFVGQLPNQIAFPGQGLPPQAPGQGAQQTQQAQQQDPANPQMPQQNGQPNQVMPYLFYPQGQGQGQGQMMQYYPFFMYPQQQQPPQQAPQQPGQQQPNDQNTPFINQRGFVPQQAAPVVPGAQQQQQQQMPNDPSAGGALTTQTMPFGGVMPQFHGDRMNFANGGLMLPTTPVTPAANALASTPDPTGDANNMKDKANFNPFMEP